MLTGTVVLVTDSCRRSLSTQRRWRKDRIQRLKLHSGALVRDVERTIVGTDHTVADREQLVSGLSRAWNAWCFSVRHRERSGAPSFGVIALGIIFNCIDHLEVIV
jgi:RNA-dependent RNA polymerase